MNTETVFEIETRSPRRNIDEQLSEAQATKSLQDWIAEYLPDMKPGESFTLTTYTEAGERQVVTINAYELEPTDESPAGNENLPPNPLYTY